MGLSKKDARTREQSAKAAAGTLVKTNASGVPAKAAKVMVSCSICKASLIASQPVTLRDHSGKHPKNTPAECFPGCVVAA